MSKSVSKKRSTFLARKGTTNTIMVEKMNSRTMSQTLANVQKRSESDASSDNNIGRSTQNSFSKVNMVNRLTEGLNSRVDTVYNNQKYSKQRNEFMSSGLSKFKNSGQNDTDSRIGVEYKLDIPTDLDRPEEQGIKEEVDLKIEKKRLRVIN